jgi:hypothetical protein
MAEGVDKQESTQKQVSRHTNPVAMSNERDNRDLAIML